MIADTYFRKIVAQLNTIRTTQRDKMTMASRCVADVIEGDGIIYIFDRYCITENDMIFIISTSGKNAVPVEMAQAATKNKIKCISVVSSEYFDDKTDGKKLYEYSDIYIDNSVPHGDAVIEIGENFEKMGSVSTFASAYIMQAVLAEGAKMAAEKGCDVSIYKSGNVDGGAELNNALIKRFMPRIKHL